MTETRGFYKVFFVLDVLIAVIVISMLFSHLVKMRIAHEEVMTLLQTGVDRQADIRDVLGELRGVCDSYAFPQIIATSTTR